MEPGGEPQRLEGLPRLLFLQRSCREGGSGLVGKRRLGRGVPRPFLRGSFFSKGLSSIFICQWVATTTQRTQDLMRKSCACGVSDRRLCPFYWLYPG